MRQGLESLRILVVDDEESIRAYVARVLASRGCIVETVGCADEALQACSKGSFDVVLSDIVMPGQMDGLELADEIARSWPATNIILMTGYAGPGRTTARKVLHKPFTPSVLLQAVASHQQPEEITSRLGLHVPCRN